MINKVFQVVWIKGLLTALERLPRSVVLGLSFGLVLALGLMNYWVVTEPLTLMIVYLLPIAIAAWFVGARPGLVITLLSAIATFGAQMHLDRSLFPAAKSGLVMLGMGVIVAELLHNLKIANEVGKQLSRVDTSTGAMNRRFFLELLEAEFHRAERYSFALTLAYIDIDNVKQTHEALGHQAGDELLYQFVEQFSQALRANDVVARLGGDEFALLLPQTNDLQAQQVFTRLQPQIKLSLDAEAIPFQYSIGVVTFLKMPETLEELTEQTEHLLKSIKVSGNNRLEFKVVP